MTQVLYSSPEFTVTLGNVATYSKIPVLEFGFGVIVKEVKLEEIGSNASVSRNFTLDSSPLFTVTSAITSPLVFSTPKIVKITLNMSVPFPVSANAKLIIALLCDETIKNAIVKNTIGVRTPEVFMAALFLKRARMSIELIKAFQSLLNRREYYYPIAIGVSWIAFVTLNIDSVIAQVLLAI
jgi:hypothetical protein